MRYATLVVSTFVLPVPPGHRSAPAASRAQTTNGVPEPGPARICSPPSGECCTAFLWFSFSEGRYDEGVSGVNTGGPGRLTISGAQGRGGLWGGEGDGWGESCSASASRESKSGSSIVVRVREVEKGAREVARCGCAPSARGWLCGPRAGGDARFVDRPQEIGRASCRERVS